MMMFYLIKRVYSAFRKYFSRFNYVTNIIIYLGELFPRTKGSYHLEQDKPSTRQLGFWAIPKY